LEKNMALAELHIEEMLPATFTAPGLSEAEFLALCGKFPDATLEYTEDGTVIVMPPTDPDSGMRVHYVNQKLGEWAERDGRGGVVGPDTGFFFPRGSRRAPDAAWFDKNRWRAAKQKQAPLTFPEFAPEFVIEVRSPRDRRGSLREKMEEYIANGVQLGWLIDPFERTVEIYRPGREPELLTNPASVAGEGPVAGFVLDLDRVFTA
jgi:Uma2 family endonuclease